MPKYYFVAEYNGVKSEKSSILHISKPETVQIELEIDPKDASSCDDIYVLFSTDKTRMYQQGVTIKDDKIDGDHKITLEFNGIKKDLNYSLIMYLGAKDDPHTLFENLSYHDLIK